MEKIQLLLLLPLAPSLMMVTTAMTFHLRFLVLQSRLL
jgi:hypothetical protein